MEGEREEEERKMIRNDVTDKELDKTDRSLIDKWKMNNEWNEKMKVGNEGGGEEKIRNERKGEKRKNDAMLDLCSNFAKASNQEVPHLQKPENNDMKKKKNENRWGYGKNNAWDPEAKREKTRERER